MSNPTLLPFFFERLKSGRIFVSNLGGGHAILPNDLSLSDLINHNFEKCSHDTLDLLYAENLISETEDQEARSSLLASQLASRWSRNLSTPSLFMVVPTLRCDHRCSYCQVSRAPATAEGYDLASTYINRIISIIDQVSGPVCKIEFQGGEPLLNLDFLQDFVKTAKERLKDREISFVVCSALGTLDDEALNWAADNSIHFSVSLDGSELVHNESRIASTKDGSHRKAIAGIERIRSACGPTALSCLSTTTAASLSRPRELVDTYFDLELDGCFIRPLSPFGFATKRSDYSVREFFDFYRKCIQRIFELNELRVFREDMLSIHLSKLADPASNSYVDLQSPAPLGLSTLVFNYNGLIFGSDEARMIWERTKNPELAISHLDDEFVPQSNAALVRTLTDSFHTCSPGCETCAFQPFCGVDPMYHLVTQGDHVGDKSRSFFCEFETEMFNLALEVLDDPVRNEIVAQW